RWGSRRGGHNGCDPGGGRRACGARFTRRSGRSTKGRVGMIQENTTPRAPTALTIAGSDSGAGAGIQADVKTFAAFGVYGTSAITAITAQNTLEVREQLPLPPHLVTAQIDAVLSDIGADAVKTGMLATADTVRA